MLTALLSVAAFSATALEPYAQLNAGYGWGMSPETTNSKITSKGTLGHSPIVGLEAGARFNDHLRITGSLDYIPSLKNKESGNATGAFVGDTGTVRILANLTSDSYQLDQSVNALTFQIILANLTSFGQTQESLVK